MAPRLDVHLVSGYESKVMSARRREWRRELHGHEELSLIQGIFTRRKAELLHGEGASALGAFNDAGGSHDDEGRNGVTAGGGVAQVPSHAGSVLDLNTPYDEGGVHQAGVHPLDDPIFIDAVAGNGGAQGQPRALGAGQLVHLWDVLDVHQAVDVIAPAAELDQDVGPASQDASLGALFGHKRYGLFEGVGCYVLEVLQRSAS